MLALAIGSLFAVAIPAQAADGFPSRAIKLVVPFAAGGPADVVARAFGQKLGAELGQSVIVENQGGAAGVTALGAVARAEADGHTLLFAASGNIVLQPQLTHRGSADLVASLRPVSLVSTSPHVLVVSSKLPVRNLKEFVDHARANPGQLSYGSAGVGGVAHLGMASLEALTGTDMVHVPYRGTSGAVSDLASGRIHALFSSYPSLQGVIDKGLVRPLAVSARTGAGPAAKLPVIASVVPGFEYKTWYGLYAPAGTPDAATERLQQAVKNVALDAALREQLAVQGVDLASSTAEELRELAKRDTEKWGAVIRRANVKLD
jgi:tripartite-type tricarboxylate transporter receptor subunit TctC